MREAAMTKKSKRRTVRWSEIEDSRRSIQPTKEMFNSDGFRIRKPYKGEMVDVVYDANYVQYWFMRFLGDKMKLPRDAIASILETISKGAKMATKIIETSIPGLGRTDFAGFFQFLVEETQKGKKWEITDNLSDRCLFMTDNVETEMLTVSINQHIGHSWLNDWRDSMDDYDRLKHLLATEEKAESFEYSIYWFDNSFNYHQKTYYLIEGLFGTQCRASVSEGWELLRPSPTWNDEFPSDIVERKE